MKEDILKYADFFSRGMRVVVELPLPDGETFRDDADIVFFDQDLLELRLSRNILPRTAVLETGADLYLRTGKKGSGYKCRAILLRGEVNSGLLIRLAGEILTLNEREYFRIDVFIPLLYRKCPDDGPETAAADNLSGREREKEISAAAETTPEEPLPVAANLSGAGVRINIPERFEIDDRLELTLCIPSGDGRTMTLDAQVVHVVPLGSHPLYSTAFRFDSIVDAEREILLKFIQKVQLEQLRRLRAQSLECSPSVDTVDDVPFLSRKTALRLFYAASALLVIACLTLALVNYYRNRDKGEIEKTFEDQVRKFIGR